MLHAAQALLREEDLRYRKHASVHAAFGEYFAKTGRIDPRYHRWLPSMIASGATTTLMPRSIGRRLPTGLTRPGSFSGKPDAFSRSKPHDRPFPIHAPRVGADPAKREVQAVQDYDIPAEAIERALASTRIESMKWKTVDFLDCAKDSLALAIEMFNRPADTGRVKAVLLLLNRSFEMPLKAIVLEKTGRIRGKREKYNYFLAVIAWNA